MISRLSLALALPSLLIAAAWRLDASPKENPTAAADPASRRCVELRVDPPSFTLRGDQASLQAVVTGVRTDGLLVDLTHEATFETSDPAVAKPTPGGRILPVGDGRAEITARVGRLAAKTVCTAEAMKAPLPINFPNQITPIFTKLGCNGGGCHGKSGGQNGYRMSLLGFEPELDYAALTKEARGRRLFPAAPEHSLLLRKGAGQVPHGGGKRLEPDSEEYRLLRQWIAAGMPYGDAKDPVVVAVEVVPTQRVLDRPGRQQLAVRAAYSDGRIEDVTRRAQFESNDNDIATVTPAGLVETQRNCGEAAIMVRYQGKVALFRAAVPLPGPTPSYEYPAQSLADPPAHRKFQQLGLVPAERCDDATFVRRATLDLCGVLPTPAEVAAFLKDADPAKRDQLVDRLIERPEYASFFANKWADILRIKRHGDGRRAAGTFGFHDWLRQALEDDLPYDQFIRAILAATGDEAAHPPVVWFKELTDYPQYVDDTAQVFLGQRLACANCHHHPFEKWSQDDYWGLAAFFGRVGRKQIQETGGHANQPWTSLRVVVQREGQVVNKRTGQPAKPKALDAPPLDLAPGEDPRQKLVDWMVDPKNPFVAKAVANRMWAHFFGRGIVEPLDDMRATNPACNDELLEALAQDFVRHGWSLKRLAKNIAKSRTYQLSAAANERNRQDKQNFSRFYPRRLAAEVLFDAVNQAAGAPLGFGGLPGDRFAPKRAIELPDEAYTTYFLEVFGKPVRSSACECERVSEASLAQILHLVNSEEVQQKIARPGGRAELLAKDGRPEGERIAELFLWCFGRSPTPGEMAAAQAHLAKLGPKKGFENLLWALINSKEFLFVH